MKRVFGAVVLCTALLAAACGSIESDWNKATTANTAAAYSAFLEKHPKDAHADTARGFILAFQDDQDWKGARAANSDQSYHDYLARYPGGLHAGEARFQIDALDRAAAWNALQGNATRATLADFVKKYPEGVESNLARERLAGMIYRARFADLRTKAMADRRRSKLEERFKGELSHVVVIPPSSTDKNYEVASQLMSESDAQAACTTAAQSRQPCTVVKGELGNGES